MFEFDFWTIWGLVSQFLFFSRFVLQWYLSEKKGIIVIPILFWYISLLGAVMVVVYAIVRTDAVFLFAGALQLLLYSRNIFLSNKSKL